MPQLAIYETLIDLTTTQGAATTIVSEQGSFIANQNAAVEAKATTVAGPLSTAAHQFKNSVMRGDMAGTIKTLMANLQSIRATYTAPVAVAIQTTPNIDQVVAAIANGR